MKILLMGFAKIKYMPYLNFYLDNIDRKKNDVHILYWNRDLCDEDLSRYEGTTLHEFRFYQEDDAPKLSKIGAFIRYRKEAKRLLNKGGFDRVIALHTLPAVLSVGILKKKYKGRYIFDYRDHTYEDFAPFKKIVAEVVEGSLATFVSSDGFRRFLPELCANKIYTSHNILPDSLLHRDEKEKMGSFSEKIRISFWGFIRHFGVNKALIEKIATDKRFELHYYGREQKTALDLKAYAAEIGADNVYFHGEYKPEDRYEFVRSTDIIHNIYDDGNMMLAMANKYYDGAIFYLPQVCLDGSFMAQSAERAGVGIGLNVYEDGFCDRLYDYYIGIDKNNFNKNCDTELDRVMKEYLKGEEIIKNEMQR